MYEPPDPESIRARVFIPFTLTVTIGNVPSRLTFVVKAVWACTLQIDVWCRPSHLLHDFLLGQALALCSPDAQLKHSRFFTSNSFLSATSVTLSHSVVRCSALPQYTQPRGLWSRVWNAFRGLTSFLWYWLSSLITFAGVFLSSHCSSASNSSMKPHFRQLGSVLTRSPLIAGNFSSARAAFPLTLLALPMVCKALTATLSLA